MKNSNLRLALALSFSTPTLASCFYLGGALSAEILLGAYTIAGLFYITATDYSPRTVFGPTTCAPKTTNRWIRRSFGRSSRALCAEKSAA